MSVRLARRGTSAKEINVSRYGPDPWRRLSPFVHTPDSIPVPGMVSYLDFNCRESFADWWSNSVEGIWQGLKSIGGEVRLDMFRGSAKKRRGCPEGHLFGDYRLLDYLEAKALIYLPAYLAQLRQLSEVIAELKNIGGPVVDVTFNPEVLGNKPISHAAVLVDYLDGSLSPFEQAHDRLSAWSQKIEQWYVDNPDAEGEPEPFLYELTEMVASIPSVEPLLTYQACAARFERENLMLMFVRSVGSWYQMEYGQSVLSAWVEAGHLELEQARKLSLRAPVCRWNDEWFARA